MTKTIFLSTHVKSGTPAPSPWGKRLVAGSLFLLIMPVAVQAQDSLFQSLDKDGDGNISLQETNNQPAVRVAFNRLDSDQDGQLDRQEFAFFRGNLDFKDVDEDHDGTISLDEVGQVPGLQAQFSALDTNNNTELTPAEFAAFRP